MKKEYLNRYFVLHANCIPTKGFNRSLITDFQRYRYYYVPNDLVEVLDFTKSKTLDEIYGMHSTDNASILNEYFDFLTDNELGFIDDEREVFPELSLEWDSPSAITNAIIDVEQEYLTQVDYSSLFQDLSNFNCACVQIRSFGKINLESLEGLISYSLNTRIKEIRLVLEHQEGMINDWINNLVNNHKRVSQILFFNCLEDWSERIMGVDIVYLQAKNLSASDCGTICPTAFNLNIEHLTESLKFNTCLNRKISVDSRGFIKNCPSQKTSYGHLRDVNLTDVVEDKLFQSLWKTKKDDIKICKDCEHRHICTDCRIFISDPNDPLSKPSKCNYDPYTSAWM
jgi:SPASM domain peptide maturase of grasp-with-spasm system